MSKFLPLILTVAIFGVNAFAQKAEPSPSPKSDPKVVSTGAVMVLTKVESLKDDIKTNETEPMFKSFKLSLPFLRGQYSTSTHPNGIKENTYYWGHYSDGTLAVQFSEFPDHFLSTVSTEERAQQLEHFVDDSLSNMGAKKLSAKDITLGKVPGKEYEVLMMGQTITLRAFINGDLLYLLMGSPKTPADKSTVLAALDSFEFITP